MTMVQTVGAVERERERERERESYILDKINVELLETLKCISNLIKINSKKDRGIVPN